MKKQSKRFITVDYEQTLNSTITLRECLPPNHLARFVVEVVAEVDLGCFYSCYGTRGGKTYAPEILLALLFYGYITGVFSSRKIEKATGESIPFRFIAGNLAPDHCTIAEFRRKFLPQIKEIFVQVLLLAQAAGLLQLGNLSLDGSKIHANASKSQAISYKRLLKLEEQLEDDVERLLQLALQADQEEQVEWPEGLEIENEIILRLDRLANLAEARVVLEERARERYEEESAEYQAKMDARAEKEAQTGRKVGGRVPQPPTPGPRDKDQFNFTDPDSRIMKNSNNKGFNQHYNVQVAVEHEHLLIVGHSLSNHPNDKQEMAPTLDAIPESIGKPEAAAMDNGFFSEANIIDCEQREIEPYIATGREPHHKSWEEFFQGAPTPPPEDASPIVKMAYKLQTEIGKAIYRLRKCTVEPVIGIIKEIMSFRQFSLRDLTKAAGEWSIVCLAYNLKRLHVLLQGRTVKGLGTTIS